MLLVSYQLHSNSHDQIASSLILLDYSHNLLLVFSFPYVVFPHFSALMEAINDDPELETGELVAVKTSENIPVQYPPEVLTNRKLTESLQSTVSFISSTLEYPKEYVVDVLARPSYWVPDSEIKTCYCCGETFKASASKHHCRSCGQGFCDSCSQERLPVPSRGWDYPVRVCKLCAEKKGPL